jgi:hypothetical protein
LSSSDFLGSASLLGDAHPISLYIINRFHVTETNALWIPIAEITLKDLPIDHVKIHGTERTNGYAGSATNALILVDHDPAEFFIPRNSLHRADDHTGSILTLLAGHGNIKPF